MIGFVTAREDATSLALCRIFVCATMCLHMVRMLALGAATFTWTDQSIGGLSAHQGLILDVLGGATEGNIIALTLVCILSSSFGALGLLTRPSLIIAWVTYRALVETTFDARSAYDTLLVNIVFILIFSGCGRALSVDARIFHRSHDVTRWPRVLLVLQIGFLYFGTALMKASSGWVPGGDASALWYILHQPLWARFGDLPMWTYPLTQAATTFVWCFELLGPVFVLSVFLKERSSTSRIARALARVHFRELYLVAGLLMHIGIEVTLEVGAFTGACLALYCCAIAPNEWRALPLRARHVQPEGVQQKPPDASRLVASPVNE